MNFRCKLSNFSPTFPFSDDELKHAGLLGDDVSEPAAQAVTTMKNHPGLLNLSLFALDSPTFSDMSVSSHFSALIFASDTTVVSEYSPDDYERTSYYNGIAGDGDHPDLVYRSDYLTAPFPKPVGRFGHIPVKSVRGVFDTPLNGIWDDNVSPQIRDVIKAHKINWTSIDPARFFTHGPPGEEEKESLGPVVIWVGVSPGSTSATAQDVSREILALLLKHGVDGVVVEWREAVPQTLAGVPLLRHVGSTNATHHVRRFLTPLLGMEKDDAQGTLTLWFRENKDRSGKPSDKVFGVSNCHVLRKKTNENYEHKGGAPKIYVRVCDMRRFQRGLDDITKAVSDYVIIADHWARDIVRLQERGVQDPEDEEELEQTRIKLNEENRAIASLEAFHVQVENEWSNIKLQRNIGFVQHSVAISVDEDDTNFTLDWAAFEAAEGKVKNEFEGNVVDLGSEYAPQQLTDMFYPRAGGPTTFKYPAGRKLRIEGCASKEDLANPADIDSEDKHCIIVGKDGNTTGLTVGIFAGLVSFKKNELGIESTEYGVYNLGGKHGEVFSAKGDSGSLVWYMRDGKAYIVGQLHSGQNKGGATSNHITYCTPGWWLLTQIKKRFPHANFYPMNWEA
ncbi:uncharacterized protein LAESUDRAFT_741859 [Laetiporus sulphureus 93-53]|uniref:Uncharacterized protein n=1 Tax=Laetiporus sulphureus 93-53 TaxID=1314785 RepID=A0A165FZ41_9APHY|nr:uncharacterized protein LAESUDRAFT_741859 [Laetiporus sulphureus 93-53]KZT09603.1 hypothetical protein LAESUDRAFT_741859 [Laetiporus sulphureus 93-53]